MGIEKFNKWGLSIATTYTHRQPRTARESHPRNAHGSPTERTHPAHYAALCHTMPKSARHTAAHYAGRVGRSIYILPRRGIVSADPLGRVQPRATLPPANGRARGDERGEVDGGRTAADQEKRRTADGQTDRPIKEKTGVVYIIRSLHNPTRVSRSIGRV